jgi:glycosyltransferase involved in cell wall biosynthesis
MDKCIKDATKLYYIELNIYDDTIMSNRVNNSLISSKIDISIIIPIYNSEKYLRKCINSILLNKKNNYEIILVNDGSNDDSATICNEFLCFNNIKYISQSHLGVSAARNKGMSLSSGKYIIFVDSDDFIDCSLIDDISKTISKTEYDIVRYGLYTVGANDTIIDCYRPSGNKCGKCYNLLLESLRTGNSDALKFCAYAVKKSIIFDNNIKFLENFSYGEDQAFTHQILMCSNTYYTLEKSYYYYKQNPQSLTHTLSLQQLQYIKAMEKVKNSLCKRNDRIIITDYESYFLPIITISTICILMSKGFSYQKIKIYMHKNKITNWKNYNYLTYNILFMKFLLYRIIPYKFIKWLKIKYQYFRKLLNL